MWGWPRAGRQRTTSSLQHRKVIKALSQRTNKEVETQAKGRDYTCRFGGVAEFDILRLVGVIETLRTARKGSVFVKKGTVVEQEKACLSLRSYRDGLDRGGGGSSCAVGGEEQSTGDRAGAGADRAFLLRGGAS